MRPTNGENTPGTSSGRVAHADRNRRPGERSALMAFSAQVKRVEIDYPQKLPSTEVLVWQRIFGGWRQQEVGKTVQPT